ncbi:MAG: tRNA1(Val) (adenine(37)-N6)-methyltransferase [Bacilli bacterium]|nr:tRNA1(Val) (adenine(37)-N6)-methyltransferase [Bacilli bacterium]
MDIIQDTDYFNFSLDSVLLPNFVTLNKNTKNIIDFCTGNAPIPLILSTKTDAKITGVELQKEIYDLAIESIQINNLENKINIINADVKDLDKMFENESFDIITCNPPYFKYTENSNINKNDIKTLARHEVTLNLNDIFKVSKKLLKNNGVIALVHRPERLVEIIAAMKENNIEPKRLQFIYPNENKESNMILIEGRKNGNPGLKVLKPLYVHNEHGNYRKEIQDMFQ